MDRLSIGEKTQCVAKISSRQLLTPFPSTRETYHVVLDMSEHPLSFSVGDSVAIRPQNDPALVEEILQSLPFSGEEEILHPKTKVPYTCKEFLLSQANLVKVPLKLCRFMEAFGASISPEIHLLGMLKAFRNLRCQPQAFINHLMPLMPRFYSISSSPNLYPHELHLTVACVSYLVDGKLRRGVASDFLCRLAEIGSTPIPFYIQPSRAFSLASPDVPIILIGPGTGVAPFRAFLQERVFQNASGKTWLFFGERNQQTDFYYEEFFADLVTQNKLSLSTAFSRDASEKTYVQHKLWEEREEVWAWLEKGAVVYVCGDANQMAKAVYQTFLEIIQEKMHGSSEKAEKYLKGLRQEKRYLTDCY